MTITLALSERVARRLARIADRDIAAIGQKLVTQGAAGVAAAVTELREAMELVTQLEAAGVRVRGDSATAPAAPQPVHSPAPAAAAPEDDDVPLGQADEAPPPAVIAARGKPRARAAFVGGDAYSGP